jgi:elongation factor G
VPIQLPIGSEAELVGIVDLVKMKAYIYKDEIGKDIEEVDIPADLVELANEWRGNLLESVSDSDDVLMEKYLEGEELTEEEVRTGLRKGTLSGKIVPMTCGSAFKNKGVQLLLDAVIDYLPAPSDVKPVTGLLPNGEEAIREAKDDAPMSALAFKIMADPYGRLTFVRV